MAELAYDVTWRTLLEALSQEHREALLKLYGEMAMASCINFSDSTITELPEAEGLIFNSGRFTHLVHSATEDDAQQICETGLTIPTAGWAPAPWDTTYMLAGPTGRLPQEATNRLLLDYRYRYSRAEPRDAKVILTFPFSRPSEIAPDGSRMHPHCNSDLVKPGSDYLRVDGETGRLYYPAEFVTGHFLHNKHAYMPNHNFVPRAPVSDITAWLATADDLRRIRRGMSTR